MAGDGTRRISLRDAADVRGWLEGYEASGYGQARRARVLHQYDAFDGVGQFGRGRRTGLWDGCGRSGFTWDRAGRLVQETRTLGGFAYTTQTAYDAAGRVARLTLPDGEQLTHTYGPHGLLTGLASSLDPALVSGALHNPLGQPTRYTLGGGPTAEVRQSFWGLDAAANPSPYGALRSLELQAGASPHLVHRALTWDAAGNLTQLVDSVHGVTGTFGYDDRDRLTSAAGPVAESFTYSPIGNPTAKNGVGYTYGDGAHKHAATAHGAATYAYDANGCMTQRNAAQGSQRVRYDPLRRPVRVDLGDAANPACRYAYDGDGIRRKCADAQGMVHHLGAYERNVGNGADVGEVVTKYYAALARLVGFRRNGAVHWVGTDHLGSTVRVADAGFAPLDELRYTPFGVSRDTGCQAALGTNPSVGAGS